jgi:hypothetical protein
MELKKSLNPKSTTIIGAILAILGFVLARVFGMADVIVIFFTLFLGIILFLIGIAGLIGNWYKSKK